MAPELRGELEALSKEALIVKILSDRQKKLRQQRRLLTVGLVVAVAIVALFSLRAINRWRDRPTYEPIQAWMTIPHIAHSYSVPPHVLAEALGLAERPPDKRTLSVIAKDQNRSVDLVIAILNDAIRKAIPPHRRPPPTARANEDTSSSSPTAIPSRSD